MKGDFTRFTFDRTRHYRGAMMQQGRVQLDADWNENLAIQAHQLQTLSRDVIGERGVPVHVDAFKIDAPAIDLSKQSALDFNISAGPAGQGRMYVAGLLVEIERDATFLNQPDWLDTPGLNPPNDGESRTDLVYLDVWPRTISAIEDPHMREIALGGPDTAERVKLVWQVKVRTVISDNPTCDVPTGLTPTGGGTLQVMVTTPSVPAEPCEPTAQGGYSGPDNRLYRVEIHQGGPLNTASFKWSRDNGAVAAGVTFHSPTELVVNNLGRDDYLRFKTGDWVEVSDDATDLSELSGTLAQIKVEEASHTLRLSQAVPDSVWKAANRHPKVRRWDGGDAIRIDGSVVGLEAGLKAQFALPDPNNAFRPGDYWTFAARVVDGSIDPASIVAAPEAPMGVTHAYANLARVTWTRNGNSVTADVKECRLLFPPLTELPRGGEQPGIHITRIDLQDGHQLFNDTIIAPDSLEKGIVISCDQPLFQDSIRNPKGLPNPVCALIVELPLTGQQTGLLGLSGTLGDIGNGVVGFLPMTLAAEVNANGTRITWIPTPPSTEWMKSGLVNILTNVHSPMQVHLIVKGNFIWGDQDPPLYLDGEAFGIPAVHRTDLAPQSGNGIRGGDFEMWFWLGFGGIGFIFNRKSALFSHGPETVAQAVSLAIDRKSSALGPLLPAGYMPDLNADFDPSKAIDLLHSLGLANGGKLSVMVLSQLVPLGQQLSSMLDNNLHWQLEIAPITDVHAIMTSLAAGSAPDMVLGDAALAQTLTQGSGGIFDASLIQL